MEVDVLNMDGQKVKTMELPSAIFEAPINIDLMHQALSLIHISEPTRPY